MSDENKTFNTSINPSQSIYKCIREFDSAGNNIRETIVQVSGNDISEIRGHFDEVWKDDG